MKSSVDVVGVWEMDNDCGMRARGGGEVITGIRDFEDPTGAPSGARERSMPEKVGLEGLRRKGGIIMEKFTKPQIHSI